MSLRKIAVLLAIGANLFAAAAPAQPKPAAGDDAPQADRRQGPLTAGRAMLSSGDLVGAVGEFSRVIHDQPKLAPAYMFRGYAYGRLKQFDKARADFDAALRVNPRLLGALAARGRLRANQGDVSGGLEDLAKALRINPKFNRALLFRGAIEVAGGDYDAAMQDFSTALKNNPDDSDAAVELAMGYDFKQQHARAIELANDVLSRHPDNAGALVVRCRANMNMGKLDAAGPDCDRAIAVNPTLIGAFINRAQLRTRTNDLAGAKDDVAKAFAISPNSPGAFQARGAIEMREGNFDAAISDFRQALTFAPAFPRAHATLGFALTQIGDLKGAAQEYGLSATLQNVAPGPHINYARALVEIGEYDHAIAEVETAMKMRNNLAAAFIVRGRAYEGKGDFPRALADFDAALKASPDNSLAQAGRDRVRMKMSAADPAAGAAPATGRVALVVGNSAYANAGALANPQRDAAGVAETLRKLGFTSVDLVVDATRAKLGDALKAFAQKAAHAEWAVIYYAGHGLEADGVNYLVPVDAALSSVEDTPNQTIALDQALNAVASAKKLRLVMLDACRDNPFEDAFLARGDGARGLARIEPDTGTLVAFATKHGHVATDGDGKDSPFEQALVKRIDTPGLEINKLFRQVHDDVATATKGQQEPFTYGQLPAEDFYFRAP
ncbi:MAG: tetratricopeptide repeat protein [Hyphomicrobiales bacterium]|nr:tetratricopeptide repeat protein [Hyphomicrobiales bacterium]